MDAQTPESTPKANQALPEAQSDYERTVCAHAEYYSALIAREGPLLFGAGVPDGGKAQLRALRLLKLETENIYQALESALTRNSLDWLLPIAVHLRLYLDMTGGALAMRASYNRLLAAGQGNGSSGLELHAHHGLAQASRRLSELEAARGHAAAAGAIARELGDSQGEAQSLSSLGFVDYLLGNHSTARDLLGQSLALRRELGDGHGEASSLNNLGRIEYSQGNYSAAFELYFRSLDLRRQLGDRHGEAQCLNNVGNIEREQGHYSAARELLAQSLALKRELGDRHGEGTSLNNLGSVERELGNYDAARGLHAQSLALMRELADRRGEALSLNNMGLAEYYQGNYNSARDLFGQALALHRELRDPSGEAYSLVSLGNLEYAEGNYSAARPLLGQSLALHRELSDPRGEAMSLSILGIVEHLQGNYSAARELIMLALGLQRGIGEKASMATGCASGAAVLAAQGRLPQAAAALYGALHAAAALDYHFDPEDRKLIDVALARLDAETESHGISADDLAQWRARGEAMSLDELAEYTLAALAGDGDA